MWIIFKVIIEFVTILLLLYDLFFLARRCVGSWFPHQEGEVLTFGPPKSPSLFLKCSRQSLSEFDSQ